MAETYDTLVPNVTDKITVKNSLFDDIKKSKIIETITKEIQKIPEHSKYRNDIELIKFSVNLAENMITEKKAGILKKEIVSNVFQKLFNLNPTEIKSLSDTIEFLKNNKKIKKIPIKRKYIYPFLRYLKKKLI